MAAPEATTPPEPGTPADPQAAQAQTAPRGQTAPAPTRHEPEVEAELDADLVAERQAVSGHVDRLRVAITSIVERVGGLAAVKKLLAVFEEYDHAGGGLSANGLAYSGLFALVPGILLVLAVLGIVVDDAAVEEKIVQGISEAFPPLAPLVETAFEQVTNGAVPTTIFAVLGLLWGSSRFYSALDYAFSRLFRTSPRRNEIQRGLRGVLVSIVFVALPILLVIVGSLATWLIDVVPAEMELQAPFREIVSLGSPISTMILLIAGVALMYRYLPNTKVPRQAYLLPAALVGAVIAIFTQIFTFIAPRMLTWAALFGALISVFAVLIWLSISLNMMLFGACWTRVRLRDLRAAQEAAAPAPPAETAPTA